MLVPISYALCGILLLFLGLSLRTHNSVESEASKFDYCIHSLCALVIAYSYAAALLIGGGH